MICYCGDFEDDGSGKCWCVIVSDENNLDQGATCIDPNCDQPVMLGTIHSWCADHYTAWCESYFKEVN